MFKIAQVVFPYPIEEEYDYIIPEKFYKDVEIGKRVLIHLKQREEEAIIVKIKQQEFLNTNIQYKEILEILDPYPVVNEHQIQLAYWMAEEYLCEVGEALDKMYPKPFKISPKQLDQLLQKKDSEILHQNLVSLSSEQETIFRQILDALDFQKPSLHLIQGITGSGKTEIYLHLIVETLNRNRTVLFIVPEISITIQLIERFKRIVGDSIAVLHSGLTGKDRYLEYLKIFFNKVKVVIGTRSAIFAPLRNLGLILIDEEHDSSLREHSHPRYDARLIAKKRAELYKIPLVLGSATPRIEIRYMTEKYHQKESKNFFYGIYFLKKRVLGQIPKVSLIERENQDQPISNELLNELEKNIKNHKQSLILLNRRGYNPYLYCKNCRKTILCPNCSISLCLHKEPQVKLKCHYCNYEMQEITHCPDCNSKLLKLGVAIQKVEEYLLNIFPDIRIERLDTDIVQKEKKLKEVIHDFIEGRIDVLTGTQMIAKSLDAPNLTLVGVLQADSGFYLPDFRSLERTFSLLVQVAGRSGRRDDTGKVFFEVMDKDHPYLRWAIHQDYDSFYQEEIKHRYQFQYPPFVRLIRFLVRSPKEKKAIQYIEAFYDILEQLRNQKIGMFDILGPSPAPILKINQKYRYHILLKTKYFHEILSYLREPIKTFKKKLPDEEYLEIEMDPVDIL